MNPMTGELTSGIRTLLTMPSILSAPTPAAMIVAPEQPADERVAAESSVAPGAT